MEEIKSASELSTASSLSKWRNHIDGLRAVAVLTVLLYHLDPNFLPGGFIGVDVFFVISGFLISKIIYNDISRQGTFSFTNFYIRRARRILPVFAVVTIAVLIAGYFAYFPDKYVQIADATLYAVAFAANIFFYLSSGYFGPGAETQPFLHYWSLGVEEQFYIFFPIIVLIVWKTVPRMLGPAIILIAMISLVAAEWTVRDNPNAAFYFSHLRAWELLAGSILALPSFPFVNKRLWSEVLSILGLLMIAGAAVLFDKQTRFPGASAILPVFGSVLILWSCEKQPSLVGDFLGLPLLRRIGLWSYSIYMVHWPLIVLSKHLLPHYNFMTAVAIFASSILLGWLLFEFVEQPFRKPRKWLTGSRLLAGSTSVLIFLMGAAVYIQSTRGFDERLNSEIREILAYQNYKYSEIYRESVCFLTPEQSADSLDIATCMMPGTKSVFLWGDSHAAHLYEPMAKYYAERGFSLSQANSSSCPPILGFQLAARPNCLSFNNEVFEWISRNPPNMVILSAIWPLDDASLKGLHNTVEKLTVLGVRVLVIGNSPLYEKPVPVLLAERMEQGNYNRLDAGNSDGNDLLSDERIPSALDGLLNARYISMRETFCNNEPCPLLIGRADVVHWDSAHFTREGANYAVDKLAPVLMPEEMEGASAK